ncbi:tRNA pseudouridine synthase 1 [Saxophila tyrrhenica]|uniref:tRNA pseudouridine synthase 1 n=1 Tax=Saxophila tyrrhenica TaxID=1690608 RepID=A0AAV9PML3_9PEZI|nr:tRNA pseudouridine synthase 1 [Saxophila tyrrhenica]
MDHSAAIMEDAGKRVDDAATDAVQERSSTSRSTTSARDGRSNNFNQRKRKGDFQNAGRNQGSRKGRGGGAHDDTRHKRGDMGRGDASNPDKRQRTDASRVKREEGDGPKYGTAFSKEEIDAEERRPKRKVAVLIGYSGTGYKGMQISAQEKTIEGDLFKAFIEAGAISKANADDPKKASLVRCARTDKNVHAAGNMISLKLIVEDDDIVEKINAALSPQIRVWGIERTIGSFSCYQACDSRWYEYLIPSYAFLPPHPSSWLAKKLEELADEAGDREGYDTRQEEVRAFWATVEEAAIKPILDSIDDDIRYDVIKALQGKDEALSKGGKVDADMDQTVKVGTAADADAGAMEVKEEKTEEAAVIINDPAANADSKATEEAGKSLEAAAPPTTAEPGAVPPSTDEAAPTGTDSTPAITTSTKPQLTPEEYDRQTRLRAATKRLRAAYNTAKRQYRIPAQRINRIQDALTRFVGTSNFHNYTIQKTFRDPSAKRHIKSFVINPQPILIGDGPDEDKTEWLSLKVHGQSFMMHQIRKMVGMVTLLVRSGADLATLSKSMTEARYSIPKVPGLGLLLERPVFDSYNNIQAPKHGRDKLDFGKFDKELEAFKQREIYQRIFREEEEKNEFVKFFNHVDNFKEPFFLYVSSMGHAATGVVKDEAELVKSESESEDERAGVEDN